MADELTAVPGTSAALFEGKRIRRVWVDGRWHFSVVDVVGLLAEAVEPRSYWGHLKAKLAEEGAGQTLQNLQQLRLEASDGKQRLTDCADTATLLRIIQSIPSPRAEPVKRWLAEVGSDAAERAELDRAREHYRRLGYDEQWIDERLKGIVARDDLTVEWRARGAQEGREFALLTSTIHKGTFDLGIDDHKAVKHLRRRDNLRESMTALELALTSLAEVTATTLHRARDSEGFDELQIDAREAGGIAGNARREIEAATGQRVVSAENSGTLTSPYRQQQLLRPAADGQEG